MTANARTGLAVGVCSATVQSSGQNMETRSSIAFIAGNRHSETLISDLLAVASVVLRPLFGNPIVSFITLLLDALT